MQYCLRRGKEGSREIQSSWQAVVCYLQSIYETIKLQRRNSRAFTCLWLQTLWLISTLCDTCSHILINSLQWNLNWNSLIKNMFTSFRYVYVCRSNITYVCMYVDGILSRLIIYSEVQCKRWVLSIVWNRIPLCELV